MILILHYIASVVLFITYTFVRPPPLTSSSYEMLTPDSKGLQDGKVWKPEPSTSAAHDRAETKGPVNWLGSLPQRIYKLVCEEEHLRYSAWILIPVWLSAVLINFWYLMGITKSDAMVSCIESPKDCVGGRLQTWIGVADASLDTNRVDQGMQLLRVWDEQDLMSSIQLLGNLTRQLEPDATAAAGWDNYTAAAAASLLQPPLYEIMEKLADISNATKRLYKPYLNSIGPRIDKWQADAKKAYYPGRIVGYTLAILFAAASLFNILRTYKRILLHRYLMTLKPHQQDAMLEELKESGSIEGGALARAMTRLRDRGYDSSNPCTKPGQGTILSLVPEESGAQSTTYQYISPCPASVQTAAQGDMMYASNSSNRSSTGGSGSPVPHMHQQQQFMRTDTWRDPDQAEARAAAAMETAASATSQLALELHRTTMNLRGGASMVGRPGAAANGGGGAADAVENAADHGASTEIMYTIQMLEDDMSVYGIGASVALFGVLVSTMWVQIRIVGFIFTMAATILFHPAFWTQVMAKWWVSIVSIIALVLFNMFVIKRYIGSKLLSDGTTIKHRGAWMTFYLVCQLAFLVVGVLYARWRVVWALIVMLLYSVACLDRSILIICKFLDGSYIAFVTSVKLEAAWNQISQQKVDEQSNQQQGKVTGTKDPESLQEE